MLDLSGWLLLEQWSVYDMCNTVELKYPALQCQATWNTLLKDFVLQHKLYTGSVIVEVSSFCRSLRRFWILLYKLNVISFEKEFFRNTQLQKSSHFVVAFCNLSLFKQVWCGFTNCGKYQVEVTA